MDKRKVMIEFLKLVEAGTVQVATDIKQLPERRFEAITDDLTTLFEHKAVANWNIRTRLASRYIDIDSRIEYSGERVAEMMQEYAPFLCGLIIVSNKDEDRLPISTHIYLRRISQYEQAKYLVEHYAADPVVQ